MFCFWFNGLCWHRTNQVPMKLLLYFFIHFKPYVTCLVSWWLGIVTAKTLPKYIKWIYPNLILNLIQPEGIFANSPREILGRFLFTQNPTQVWNWRNWSSPSLELLHIIIFHVFYRIINLSENMNDNQWKNAIIFQI